jgi:hypothetical protein
MVEAEVEGQTEGHHLLEQLEVPVMEAQVEMGQVELVEDLEEYLEA